MSDMIRDFWAIVICSKIYTLRTLRISKVDTSLPISAMRYRLVMKTELECKAVWVGDTYLHMLLSRDSVKKLKSRFRNARTFHDFEVRAAHRLRPNACKKELRRLRAKGLALLSEGEEVQFKKGSGV